MNSSPYQKSVAEWMQATFGEAISSNQMERCYRFFEEGTELVQSAGMSREDAHRLVDYVYDRPVGDVEQEVGGTLVTLAALCNTMRIDFGFAAERELSRCWKNMDKIRKKQQEKAIRDGGLHSPLPGPST